ncbi:hypothetical protein HAX54_042890 [Datura stramonium]|uniref:Uncharacterized protein n=1 Tax=Datura stramonium TaxID=4076 RepID=A0ABS8W1M2_DATST|nr:hypothetical protein [Datura stramonium]
MMLLNRMKPSSPFCGKQGCGRSVHGPLGEYRKLEQQLKEERRNNQLQIVQLPDVPQLPQLPDVLQLPPPPTTSESTIRYLPPLAVVDQNMGAVAPTENGANDSMQGYNMLNSTVTNYSNLLRWHRHEGEAEVTSRNGYDSFGNFPSHYNRPIEQMLHGFIPTSAGGIVHHPSTTYNNGAHHVQLHQPRYPYYMDLGRGSRGRRRKDHSDQFVSPGCSGRHVRGRGIGPISTTTSSSLAGPIIRQGPIISTSSLGTFVDSSTANARAMVNPSVNGSHVEEGKK